MKAKQIVVATLGMLLLIPAAAGAQDVSLPIGTVGPDAAVQNLQGRPIQLRSVLAPGKPTVIEFWAVWCGECEALQPQFDAIKARYGDRINIVAIAVGVGQTLRRVNDHLKDHNPGYPFVWDARGAAVRAYEAPSTATVVILDRQGRVVYTGTNREQNLLAQVERVLRAR